MASLAGSHCAGLSYIHLFSCRHFPLPRGPSPDRTLDPENHGPRSPPAVAAGPQPETAILPRDSVPQGLISHWEKAGISHSDTMAPAGRSHHGTGTGLRETPKEMTFEQICHFR